MAARYRSDRMTLTPITVPDWFMLKLKYLSILQVEKTFHNFSDVIDVAC
jgi:hypothetical protein